MHLLHHEQQNQLFCIFFILVTRTISIPITEPSTPWPTVPTTGQPSTPWPIVSTTGQRSTPWPTVPTTDQRSTPWPIISTSRQPSTPWPTVPTSSQRSTPWPTPSTTRIRSTTKSSSASDFDAFSENLKRAALILAGIALGLGFLRICLMLCKSRSRSTSLSNRHSSTVRPQISTVEHHQFKPDLPPAYAEAIANMGNDGEKLPSYDELPYEQRQQHVYNIDDYNTTRM